MSAQVLGFVFIASIIGLLLISAKRQKSKPHIDSASAQALIVASKLAQAARIFWRYTEILKRGVTHRKVSELPFSKAQIREAIIDLLDAGKARRVQAAMDRGLLGLENDIHSERAASPCF